MKRFILGLVVASACGGGSSAVDKCDDLVDVTCDRAVECIPSGGTHAQCVEQVQAQLPCGSAKKVSASYSRCISQLKSTSCASLFPAGNLQLPADCNGVILTERLDPGTVVGPATGLVDERD